MAVVSSQYLHRNEVSPAGDAHRHILEHGKLLGCRNNLRLYAGGRKKQIDVHGPLTVSSEAHSRDSPGAFLLEQHSHNITAALKVKHEPLRGIVAIRVNRRRPHHESYAVPRARRPRGRQSEHTARRHHQVPRKCASARARRGSAARPRRRDPYPVTKFSTGAARVPSAHTLFQDLLGNRRRLTTKPLPKHAFRDVDQRERNAQLFARRLAARLGHDARVPWLGRRASTEARHELDKALSKSCFSAKSHRKRRPLEPQVSGSAWNDQPRPRAARRPRASRPGELQHAWLLEILARLAHATQARSSAGDRHERTFRVSSRSLTLLIRGSSRPECSTRRAATASSRGGLTGGAGVKSRSSEMRRAKASASATARVSSLVCGSHFFGTDSETRCRANSGCVAPREWPRQAREILIRSADIPIRSGSSEWES